MYTKYEIRRINGLRHLNCIYDAIKRITKSNSTFFRTTPPKTLTCVLVLLVVPVPIAAILHLLHVAAARRALIPVTTTAPIASTSAAPVATLSRRIHVGRIGPPMIRSRRRLLATSTAGADASAAATTTAIAQTGRPARRLVAVTHVVAAR